MSSMTQDELLLENNPYYNLTKDLFTKFSQTKSRKFKEPSMHILTLSQFLRRVKLLMNEFIVTHLDIDELFNEFNVEYINFTQFIEMMKKLALKKNLNFNAVLKFIVDQFYEDQSETPNLADNTSSRSSSISSRSDASDAYTYYPRHELPQTCPDELSSSEDEPEKNEDDNDVELDADNFMQSRSFDLEPPASNVQLHVENEDQYEDFRMFSEPRSITDGIIHENVKLSTTGNNPPTKTGNN